MNRQHQTYFCRPPEFLSKVRIPTRVMESEGAMMEEIAGLMYEEILKQQNGGRTVLICPVGPAAQYPILAQKINESGTSLRHVWFANMDEYLTDDGRYNSDKNFSFQESMEANFYSRIRPELLPPKEQRLFPDPGNPQAIDDLLESMGGADLMLTGVGINGHLAFNEPPQPEESITDQEFLRLPTRILPIAEATRINNGGRKVAGALDIFPKLCVTLGMKQLLDCKTIKIYLYCDWQWGVMRKLSLEAPSRFCPASFLQTHPDAEMVISRELYEFMLPHSGI